MKEQVYLFPLCILFVAYLVSPCSAKVKLTVNHAGDRHRVKREDCQDGYDEATGCCRCPPGFHVETKCNPDNRTVQTTCKECNSGTHSDHSNYDLTCELCTVCDSKGNLEEVSACTPQSDTKCRCQKGYYCETEECKACHACKMCEDGLVVEEECTPTNNTVCKDSQQGGLGLIAIIIVPIFIGGIIYFLKRKEKYCFDNSRQTGATGLPETNRTNGEYTLLKGIDLRPHLYEIVEELGPGLTKQLAISSGLTEAKIEFHISNYPNNTKEQYYNILRDWTEQQGLDDAFPNLIKELHKLGKKGIADKLEKNILEKV